MYIIVGRRNVLWLLRTIMSSARNLTTCASSLYEDPLCLQSTYIPWYATERPLLIDGVPDHYLALAAPVIAYWSLSLFFHFLDTRDWKVLDKYRLHPSEEVASRNLVSRSTVVYAVFFQHIIQTILGLYWLTAEAPTRVPHSVAVHQIASILHTPAELLGLSDPVLLLSVSELIYWWAIPALQLLVSM